MVRKISNSHIVAHETRVVLTTGLEIMPLKFPYSRPPQLLTCCERFLQNLFGIGKNKIENLKQKNLPILIII
jgi:hypothetical protein